MLMLELCLDDLLLRVVRGIQVRWERKEWTVLVAGAAGTAERRRGVLLLMEADIVVRERGR